jgi:uncharacterized protein YnzC (UPF0291/DUF896 family)
MMGWSMERLERINRLLIDADTQVGLARQFMVSRREEQMREYMKKARKMLKLALEALDGVD